LESDRKHVLVLLLKSPEWTLFHSVVQLSVAMIDEGARLTLFIMDDAVLGLYPRSLREPDSFPLHPIIKKGGTILVCQSTSEMRGVTADRLPTGARFETQVQLGRQAGEADLFLPFV
jgi:uncharacterized protein involved in oxidation of intracellular sulfur